MNCNCDKITSTGLFAPKDKIHDEKDDEAKASDQK